MRQPSELLSWASTEASKRLAWERQHIYVPVKNSLATSAQPGNRRMARRYTNVIRTKCAATTGQKHTNGTGESADNLSQVPDVREQEPDKSSSLDHPEPLWGERDSSHVFLSSVLGAFIYHEGLFQRNEAGLSLPQDNIKELLYARFDCL